MNDGLILVFILAGLATLLSIGIWALMHIDDF